MQLIQESVFLKILGWSLFNSLWQMAVLWLLYNLLSGGGKKFSSPYRHGLALFLLGIGTLWFIFDLCDFKGNEGTLQLISTLSMLNRRTIIPQNNLYSFLFPYFALGYLVLIIVQGARYTLYYQNALYRRKSGMQNMPVSLKLFVEDIAKQLGISQRVNIWLSPWVESPLTMGLLKSIILFPLAMINHLSTKQVEALLLHELAHIKRNDYFLNLLVTIVNITFFFNPFSRLLIQHIRREMENSCDDLVMQFGYEPSIYCSALLSLEKNRNSFSVALAATGGTDYLLLDRVKRITGLASKAGPNKSNKDLFLLLLVAFGLTLFIASLPKSTRESHPEKVISEAPLIHSMTSPNGTLRINQAQILKMGFLKNQKSGERLNKKGGDAQMVYLEDYFSQVKENHGELSASPVIMEATQDIPSPDFSMAASPYSRRTEVPRESSIKGFPYVANSSFNFHIVQDSLISTKEQINDEEDAEDELIRKAIMTYDYLLGKMKDQGITGEKKMDQLKSLIQAALDARDVESLSEEKNARLTDAEVETIRIDLDLHRKILENKTLSKNADEVEKLKKSIINGQLKLHRDALLKQMSNLKKIQEFLKNNKIVYI